MINSVSPANQDRKDFYKKLKAGAGALVSTAVPMAILMKQKKIKNPFKMEYGLQDMLILSASSVGGGTCIGMLGEDEKTRHNKIKEGVFQFLNAAIPTWIIGGVLKLPESSHRFNNPLVKVFSVFLGMAVGMFGAAHLSNLICDPKDKIPDRKLTFKDCVASADDALGALVLAKFPLMDKLQVEKILPAIYAYCGYRAGTTK